MTPRRWSAWIAEGLAILGIIVAIVAIIALAQCAARYI